MAMGAEKKTRLDKYVAQALEIPRSASREMIAKGRVTVNGQVCKRRTPSWSRWRMCALVAGRCTMRRLCT